MNDQPVLHDERTVAVENASYRWGFMLVSFGLLIIVAVRGFLFNESNWDLMALVILGSLATTVYQGVHRILSRRLVYLVVVTALVAAVVAAATVLLQK